MGGGFCLIRRAVQEPLQEARKDSTLTVLAPDQGRAADELVVEGPVGGSGPRSYRLDGTPVHLGRAAGNELVLRDPRVSGCHCRFEPHPEGLFVRDLGSKNGTYVQGIRIERAVLTQGARMRVGDTEIRLSSAGPEVGAGRGGILAASPQMLGLVAELRTVAPLGWPVLIHGESGTGKEGIAGALHRLSPRAHGPLVTLNAGGVARELVESELFGHERGSFTGASGDHRGVFEQADGGTLFLDEIGELPPPLQARLLRVLEQGEIRRVGAERTRRVSVRLVCATHRDLRQMVAQGTFRQDLYYRIARVVLEVPALRDRPEDIDLLAQHFLREIVPEVGPRVLSQAALSRLRTHPLPGNARELRNVLCAAAASTSARVLEAADVERAMARVGCAAPQVPLATEDLVRAVAHHGGNLSAAARALGIPRSTLRDRIRAA